MQDKSLHPENDNRSKSGLNDESLYDASQILKSLNKILTFARLYPANNQIYLLAMKEFLDKIEEFIKSNGEFSIVFKRGKILYKTLSIEEDNEIFQRLAFDFYTRGVRAITFLSGVQSKEILGIVALLDSSCEDFVAPDVVKSYFKKKDITHIKVIEGKFKGFYSIGDFFEKGTLKRDIDEEISDEIIEYQLGMRKDLSEEARRILLNLLAQPKKFAKFIQELSLYSNRNRMVESQKDAIFSFYERLRDMVKKSQKDEVEQDNKIYWLIAETLRSLSPELKVDVITEKLVPNMKNESLFTEILDNFSEQELTELITLKFLEDDADTNDIVDYFHMNMLHTEKFQKILDIIKSKFVKLETPEATDLHFRRHNPEAVTNITPDEIEYIESLKLGDFKSRIANLLEYREDDLKRIGGFSKLARREEVLVAEINVLLGLVILENAQSFYPLLIDAIEDSINRLISSKSLESIVKVLTVFKSTDYSSVNMESRIKIDSMVERLESKENITNILSMLRYLHKEKDIEEFNLIRTYLSMLRVDVVPFLIDRLAEERDMIVRKSINMALVEVGRDNLDCLIRGLNHEKWYLVRNIILVLGEIGDQKALPHLERMLNHEEIKVRAEAIKAISNIAGSDAGNILLPLLEDRNNKIRLLTIQALGMCRIEAALPQLYAIVKKIGIFGRVYSLKKEAINAIGEIGSEDSIDFLNKNLRRRWWMSKKKHREFSLYLRRAIDRIKSTREAMKE